MLLLCGTLFISGFVLLGLGAWIRYGAASFVDVLGPFSAQFINISYICIAMGSVLSFISLIGCCGAYKENRFFIMLFFFIVTVLFVAQIVGIIFVMVYRDLLRIMVYKASKKSLQTAYMGPAATDPVSSAWNIVMIKFKCCGFENKTLDFVNSAFNKVTGLDYPKTCCVIKTAVECDGTTVVAGLIQPEVGCRN
ncbi:tetraspanin-16-like [Aplochiton taeniatus]